MKKVSNRKIKKEKAIIHNENNKKIEARKPTLFELFIFMLIKIVAIINGAEVTARKVIVENSGVNKKYLNDE
jgi:hypothetical protein